MAYKSTYTADSDADDEFERTEFASPTVPPEMMSTDSDDMTSPEHTPTTFTHSHSGGSHASPTSIITQWSPEQCADYLDSLGLGQYGGAIIDENVTGDSLVYMQHEDLKDMGMMSLGHRLTLLKAVYELKSKQNIPIDEESYVPLSVDSNNNDMQATQDDIARVIESIRLRDMRIISAEAELRSMKEDLNRLVEENRKLREETLPLIRLAKDRSHPLPNPEQPMTTPPPDLRADKIGGGLSRKFSTKRLFLGPTPKIPSPTIAIGQQPLQDTMSLDPSAAAVAASSHLTASMASQPSPNQIPQLSPTSPAYSVTHAPTSGPRFPRGDNSSIADSHYPSYYPPTSNPREQPPNTAPLPSSASTITATTHREKEKDNIEIFKSFRVSIEDPCYKVLPVALKRYQINDDWRQYALYIVYGDQERCLGLEEKPLMLFKQLDREGRKPMFMLRKHASPATEGWSGPGGSAAAATAAAGANGTGLGGTGTGLDGRGLPGGVL